ncbi:MAG: hypothetical protein K2Z81_20545, partial [Cyanobacteria bacterium]|nr:hypothetical protein [Cyanobacteriota bacterium]
MSRYPTRTLQIFLASTLLVAPFQSALASTDGWWELADRAEQLRQAHKSEALAVSLQALDKARTLG